MKLRNILLILALVFATTLTAQKKYGLGVHLTGVDFNGPLGNGYFLTDNTYKSGVDTVTKSNFNWTPSGRLSFWRNGLWTNNLDLNFNWTVGSGNTPINDSMLSINDFKIVQCFDARLSYNLIDKWSHTIAPYLYSGASLANHGQGNKNSNSGWGFQIPVGIGFNINVSNDHNLQAQLESGYEFSVSDNAFDNLQHSLGLVYFFDGKQGEVAPPPPPPPPLPPPAPLDTDGDGISDDVDKCPDVAGVASLGGCPDADGDGISDAEDQCPSVRGVVKYSGCPIPDTDNDGFNDEEDKCPNVASPTNNGCPVVKQEVVEKIEEAAGQVHFESSKSKLTVDSDENLDIIAGLLRDNPTYKCDIEGHTDASGSYDFNKQLSEARAKVCYDYLVSKGIDPDRLTYKGYGPDVPVATNDTKEGRAKNRRTEFKLHL